MIPFSEIKIVSNLTKEFSYSLVECNVAYNTDIDKVYECLKDISITLQNDQKYAKLIIGNLEIIGVVGLDDYSVRVRSRIKTIAGEQFTIKWELLRLIHQEFPKYGIEIPFPIQTLRVKKSDNN